MQKVRHNWGVNIPHMPNLPGSVSLPHSRPPPVHTAARPHPLLASTHPPAAHPTRGTTTAPAARLACDEARRARIDGESGKDMESLNMQDDTEGANNARSSHIRGNRGHAP